GPLQPAADPAHEKTQAGAEGPDHQARKPVAAGHYRVAYFTFFHRHHRADTQCRDPVIQVSRQRVRRRTWIAGSSPAMTVRGGTSRSLRLPPRQISRVPEVLEVFD